MFSMGRSAQPKEVGRFDLNEHSDTNSEENFDIDIEGNESSSLINQGKEKATEVTKQLGATLESVGDNVKNKVEEKTGDLTKPNYIWMAVFFAISCLFMLAAFTALPFILFSPGSFNLYFSLATFNMLVAVSFYYGPITYFKSLFERKNLAITVLYLCSILASLSTIFHKRSYLVNLLMIGLQGVSFFFFVYRVFAGGENAQEKLKGMMTAGATSV